MGFVKILQRIAIESRILLVASTILLLPAAIYSFPVPIDPQAGVEPVQGNARYIRVYQDSELYEEYWYNQEGQLNKKSSYRTGSIPLSTYYEYNSEAMLEKWYQEGINNQRIWSFRLEYDREARPLRLLSLGSDNGIEYLEEYRYLEDSIQETVLYNAAGEPVWRRRVEESGNTVSWELFQSNGVLASHGLQYYNNGQLAHEQVFDNQGTVLEETRLSYDEQGRLVGREVHDSHRLVQQFSLVYLSDDLVFSRLYEPHPETAVVQQMIERRDEQGNWIERIETSLLEESEGIQTINERQRMSRVIRYW